MTSFTVDASVHINALNPAEPDSAESQGFLDFLRRGNMSQVCPTLLIAEVSGALARAFDDHEESLAFALAIRNLPNVSLIPLDELLAVSAAELAARYRLRGADAVYAAVAQRHQTVLVTNDRQQLERLAIVLPVMPPAQALSEYKE